MGVMGESSSECFYAAAFRDKYPLMDQRIGKGYAFTAKKAQRSAPAATEVQSFPIDRNGPGKFISIGIRVGQTVIYFAGQLFSNAFVGIQRQHPIARCPLKSSLFLYAEAWPVGGFNNVGILLCNLYSAIGAATVQHNYFIGDLSG